jgi:hypothetical protein
MIVKPAYAEVFTNAQREPTAGLFFSIKYPWSRISTGSGTLYSMDTSASTISD